MTPEERKADLRRRQLAARQSIMASQGEAQQPIGQPADEPQDRSIGAALYDNVIGNPNDGVDSFGERAGRTINDMGKAGLAGVSRGVSGLMDIPGLLVGGSGKAAAGGLESLGVISPEVAEGVRQSFDMSPMGTGSKTRDNVSALTGGASDFRGDTTAGEYAGTVGEFLPGAVMGGGGNVGNLLRYGVVPAVSSEAAGQLTEGTAAEPWARAGAALAAGPLTNLAEKGVRKLISPHGGADAGRLALAKVLDDFDVPISAGQRVGSETLRRKEGLTGAGQRLNDAQREAMTKAALKTTGTDASRATPDVLSSTAKRIGDVFDDVSRGVNVSPTPEVVNKLADASQTYQQLAPKSTQAPLIGEILKRTSRAMGSGNDIPAATVNSWRSKLSKLTTSPDNATREAAIEAMGAIDDALTGALTSMGRSDDVARLATAREQWRNFLAIQKAATGAGEGAAAGVLTPSSLRNAVVTQGRSSYAQGSRGDIANLARASEGVMKPLPTSGTAENIRALGLPMVGWSGAGAAAGSSLGPAGAAIGAGVGASIPGIAGAARMSSPVQSWLSNQSVGAMGPVFERGAMSPVPAALMGLLNDSPQRQQ